MNTPGAALWRRRDAPGHDAALLSEAGDGWLLTGVAAWDADGEPAALAYRIELDAGWWARAGWFGGSIGARRVERHVVRDAAGWTFDGTAQPGLDGVVDLDFGFTPATNCPQLRRLALAEGEGVSVRVAWIDVGGDRLAPLAQDYRRIGADRYAYASPAHGYRATLTVAEDGFVADYPGLWTRERA